MVLLQVIFWASVFLIIYVHFGYAVILRFASIFFSHGIARDAIEPKVSIIIAAHNEAEVIGAKLENCLQLAYPSEQVEIVVASDGSQDHTIEIARRFESARIKVRDLPRVGKIKALNNAVAASSGEILVFTDANAMLDTNALRELVANFADEQVGGVCGNQRYKRVANNVADGENLYWKYDKFVKDLESRIGSTVAADGSLYAIRSSLFQPLINSAQADDHAISSRVVTQGYRLILERNAIAYEEAPARDHTEFRRKIRVVNHTLGSIFDLPEALNPLRTGFYAIELFSHKLLRYMVPFLMIAAFLTNLALVSEHNIYRILLTGQALFYVCAFIGYRFSATQFARFKLFYAPYYFCLANAAALLGVLGRMRGDRFIIWQPRGDAAAIGTRR